MEGVYRFLLTPRWWGINVFVVLAIPFCIFMGSWQLGRFEDRVQDHETASTQQESAAREAARPLTELLPVDKATVGRQTTVTGRYDDQLLVPERKLDDREGFYVLTLLRTVTGALQAAESPGAGGVSGRSGWPDGQTGAISAATLLNLVPYDVYDAWVTLNEGDSGMRAVPVSAPQNTGLDLKAFQNLGYTAEWFAFVGFVIFMWFRLLRREVELARDAELGLVAEDGKDGEDTEDEDAGRARAGLVS